MANPRENSPYRLLVEGKNDKWPLIALLERHGFDWKDDGRIRPYVEETGGVGKGKLLDEKLLGVTLKSIERVGLVLDADPPPANRWEQARDLLRKLGVEMPDQPDPAGLVVVYPGAGSAQRKRLGLWLMPDNQRRGILEDFLSTLVPPGDPLWPLAEEATRKARAQGARLSERDLAKGYLHTWLAWQEEPGLPFGTAVTSQILGNDSAEARAFVAWFHRLFYDAGAAPQAAARAGAGSGPVRH